MPGADTTKKGHFYSFTLTPGGGFSSNANHYFNHYVRTMSQTTSLENMHLEALTRHERARLRITQMQGSAEWRYKFKAGRVLKQWEWSTGLGFMQMEGEEVRDVVSYDPAYVNGPFRDTLLTQGMPLRVSSVYWSNRISLHSASFLRFFGLFTGLEWTVAHGTYGRTRFPATIGQTEVHYTRGTSHVVSVPIGLKCNISCELNLEFIYKPGFIAGADDLYTPANYSQTHSFGIGLRYKLQNSPPADTRKRTDMFF